MKRCRVIALVAAAVLSAACTSTAEVVTADVNPLRWDYPVELRFDNSDDSMHKDVKIMVRYRQRAAADSLALRISTQTPDSMRFSEYAVLPLSHPEQPAAQLPCDEITYDGIRFDRRGVYVITITPRTPVAGIEAIGIGFDKN